MNKPSPVSKIDLEISAERLQKDLEALEAKAQACGAAKTRIIPANWAAVDERVRLKCSVPLCPYYNKNIYCPPNGPSIDLVRNTLARFRHALLYAIDVPPGDFADRSVEKNAVKKWAKINLEVAARVETLALSKGYYLAMGFAQVSCIKTLCGQDRCLVLSGGKCPYPLKSRPSMESMGIDVFGLVTRVGWDIYPIYRSVDPAGVPKAMSVGIVFVR
jgi:predicted metal-binding protein